MPEPFKHPKSGVYYYRRVVPAPLRPVLGRTEFRISLGTKSLREAKLKYPEQAGIIFRRYTPTIPPQVTYCLTARGEELRAVLDDLNAVARRWQEEDRATAA